MRKHLSVIEAPMRHSEHAAVLENGVVHFDNTILPPVVLQCRRKLLYYHARYPLCRHHHLTLMFDLDLSDDDNRMLPDRMTMSHVSGNCNFKGIFFLIFFCFQVFFGRVLKQRLE